MTGLGTAFALIIGKHLYGGLGQNPFNPAMLAYCLLIVSFPALMSQWPGLQGSDAATHCSGSSANVRWTASPAPRRSTRCAPGCAADGDVAAVLQSPTFGNIAGAGWEWVALAWAAAVCCCCAAHHHLAHPGGLHRQRWRWCRAFALGDRSVAARRPGIPPAGRRQHAVRLLHRDRSGSGATTPRGKLVFAAAIALIAWIIRTWGAYPDGIAFAVLLLNICVPLIDSRTQPPVFGHKRKGGGRP
jgi:electron transport complex protein RnfD